MDRNSLLLCAQISDQAPPSLSSLILFLHPFKIRFEKEG